MLQKKMKARKASKKGRYVGGKDMKAGRYARHVR